VSFREYETREEGSLGEIMLTVGMVLSNAKDRVMVGVAAAHKLVDGVRRELGLVLMLNYLKPA
jgi:hypothetical protein